MNSLKSLAMNCAFLFGLRFELHLHLTIKIFSVKPFCHITHISLFEKSLNFDSFDKTDRVSFSRRGVYSSERVFCER
jgi:hypothetical protein